MKWELKKYDIKYLTKKSSEFGESKLITRLLLNRGIDTQKKLKNF